MKLLLLNGFNNYFDRRIKYYSSYSDYETAGNGTRLFTSIDFNPNDGVNTTQTINGGEDGFEPDYLIVASDESTSTISSRWFVIEWKRTRYGQYKATLRRDVIADNYGTLLREPIYLQRGPVAPNDPLIFNPEGISFNQIKKQEILLPDSTGKAWIVGYINSSYANEESISSISADDTTPTIASLGIELTDSTNPTLGGTFQILKDSDFHVSTIIQVQTSRVNLQFHLMASPINGTNQFYLSTQSGYYLYSKLAENVADATNDWEEIIHGDYQLRAIIISDGKAVINSLYPNVENLQAYNKLLQYDGKLVQHNGSYYRIKLNTTPAQANSYIAISNSNYPSLYSELLNAGQTLRSERGATTSVIGSPFGIYIQRYIYSITITEAVGPNILTTKISNSRRHLSDAPYDMFAIEYNLGTLSLAQRIALKLTTSNLYDIQILPYCPIENLSLAVTNNVDYSEITNASSTVVYKMYYARISSRTFFIDKELTVPVRTGDSAKDIKIANECDVYRLCSPNYNSAFEFSVAKNNGVHSFRVDYTYRPISPFIHIAPVFGGLYGNDFGDSRGLICGGDFSVDVLSSAWQNYQINNKNYQNIFNTQIKQMDINYKYGMMESGINAITGAVGIGVGAGIFTNNIGLGAGAGVASLAGGIADQFISAQKYKENKQISIDQYNYSLGNVKAIPNTLTKISAYDVINKYFPFIEYYTATDEEIELLENKIQYQSYTYMKITTLYDLMGKGLIIYQNPEGSTFVKGELIWQNYLRADDHLANEIYNELYKGVYL